MVIKSTQSAHGVNFYLYIQFFPQTICTCPVQTLQTLVYMHIYVRVDSRVRDLRIICCFGPKFQTVCVDSYAKRRKFAHCGSFCAYLGFFKPRRIPSVSNIFRQSRLARAFRD